MNECPLYRWGLSKLLKGAPWVGKGVRNGTQVVWLQSTMSGQCLMLLLKNEKIHLVTLASGLCKSPPFPRASSHHLGSSCAHESPVLSDQLLRQNITSTDGRDWPVCSCTLDCEFINCGGHVWVTLRSLYPQSVLPGYTSQRTCLLSGWLDGWMDGSTEDHQKTTD